MLVLNFIKFGSRSDLLFLIRIGQILKIIYRNNSKISPIYAISFSYISSLLKKTIFLKDFIYACLKNIFLKICFIFINNIFLFKKGKFVIDITQSRHDLLDIYIIHLFTPKFWWSDTCKLPKHFPHSHEKYEIIHIK